MLEKKLAILCLIILVKKGIIVDENLCSSIFAKSVNCDTLLIHDKNDKEVSIDDSKKIEKNLSKVLKLYTIIVSFLSYLEAMT